MDKPIREKPHRLDADSYKGFQIVAFTARLRLEPLSTINSAIFDALAESLVTALHQHKSSAEVYLIMPDHGPFLLRGGKSDANVLEAMRSFKHLSGYWLHRHRPDIRWQKDFYDHIVRSDDDMHAQIRYILENPVRKGLVDSWQKYPFKGSTVYNLQKWDEDL